MNRIWVKLSAVIVILLLILMGVVFHFFTAREIRLERQELQRDMERVAKLIASIRFADAADLSMYQDWIDRIMESEAGENLVYIAIFDNDRKMIAYTLDSQDLDVESSFLTPDEEYDLVLRLTRGQIAEESWNDFDRVAVTIRFDRESRGKVDVGFSLIEFNDKSRHKLWMNIYILGISFLVVVILSILIGRRITKPLNKLSRAMLEVSNGNYEARVESRSKDEIGRLASSFNYMTLRLSEKSAIEDFSRDLVFSFEHSRLVQMVTDRIVNYMDAKQGVLFLIQKRGAQTVVVSKWGCPQAIGKKIEHKFTPECYQECLQRTEPFELKEIHFKDQFNTLTTILRQQVEFDEIDLIAPLVSQGETLGFLLLSEEVDESGYDPDERTFLRTLSHQAGMAIRNSILLQDLTEQERIKKELEIARSVQKSLLPARQPNIPGIDIVGLCIPAAEVGGDYYDYFYIDDHRIGIAIADVSGKGASAAFYMAEIKGMMTSLADLVSSPKKLVAQLNKYLNKNIDKRVFTTMIYGVLDIRKHQFSYVRAGHNAVIARRIRNNNDIDVFIPPGMGLGLVDDATFYESTEEHHIQFEAGDVLFLYTDGISEAMNRNREEFGEERLYNIIAGNHVVNAHDMQRRVMQQINEFVQDAKQHDDITMIIAQFV
ncbi:SpoIIE family protein phosphatase [candidate division KSB1 bacterium]|nr:SpoIIE family protein phosphatase [candidate division KSB1 bacterium]RQW06585.1 MAG: HAMP domain-containing protein [candidate division KSB1 bacterium]